MDIDGIPGFIRDVEERERLLLAQGRHEVDFPRDNGMRFHNGNLPLHEAVCKSTPITAMKSSTAKLIIPSAAVLSSMKNTLVRMLPTSERAVSVQICHRTARVL